MGGGGWRNQGLTSTRQLPSCYPSPGNDENTKKSLQQRSVRDRGVGGSNPLAPTNSSRNLGPVFRAFFLYGTAPYGLARLAAIYRF
jgi:hypothetical protein